MLARVRRVHDATRVYQLSQCSPLLHSFSSSFSAELSICAEKDGENGSIGSVPNILVILADDLGYSDLGCYGGEIATPNIDALARRGVRFTQALQLGAVLSEPRVADDRAVSVAGGDWRTSRPPKPSPDRGPGYLGRLNEQCVTLAEVLKPAGYGCYYVGKWHMHEATGPIQRGFDEFYGYTRDHSHDQYDADYYLRLPAGRAKEIDPPASEFYATDVFNAYALEFIRQGQARGQPWFLFLGHSSPHFPVQAPAERADKYDDDLSPRLGCAARGAVRAHEEDRADRRRALEADAAIARAGRPRRHRQRVFRENRIPPWDSLDEDRQRDLARRMAVFAAMVETVDQGVGQIVQHLQATGDLDNTLILFLSDNGACYEWGPFGFDGESRRGTTTLRTGDDCGRSAAAARISPTAVPGRIWETRRSGSTSTSRTKAASARRSSRTGRRGSARRTAGFASRRMSWT